MASWSRIHKRCGSDREACRFARRLSSSVTIDSIITESPIYVKRDLLVPEALGCRSGGSIDKYRCVCHSPYRRSSMKGSSMKGAMFATVDEQDP